MGDIDYAVCDESIARAVTDSIPQIDINTDISFTQFYSWESANNHLFYWTALTAGFRLFGTVMSLNLSTVNITGLRIRDKFLSNKYKKPEVSHRELPVLFFSILSFMPWNCQFHCLELLVSSGETTGFTPRNY